MENENNVISNETNINVIEENAETEIDGRESCEDIEKSEDIKPLKKKKTKILLCAVFVCLLVICSIFTYFKLNENVFKVEKMIANMGEITLDSKELIQDVEDSYNSLSDSEKKRVKNKNVLDENKKIYENLLIESFESSELYSSMKKIISLYMSMYNPKTTFDKAEKTLTISIFVDSDIEELLRYYPTIAKPTWNQTVRNMNSLAKSIYDSVKEYHIDVVLEMYPESSPYSMLFESLNGETKFDVLD